MSVVKLALDRPYTFVVLAVLILLLGVAAVVSTPTDIFPRIDIPVVSVIWTYDGWIAVSMIAGEVVAPERLMKRIIITGMLIIVTLYIGANLAYLYMMPVSVMAQQKAAIARTVMTDIAADERRCLAGESVTVTPSPACRISTSTRLPSAI